MPDSTRDASTDTVPTDQQLRSATVPAAGTGGAVIKAMVPSSEETVHEATRAGSPTFESQLAALLSTANQRGRKGSDLLEQAIKLLQVIAIVVGAGWAFFRYTTFEKERGEREIELQKLQLSKAEIESKYIADEKKHGLSGAVLDNRLKEAQLTSVLERKIQVGTNLKAAVQNKLASGLSDYTSTFDFTITNTSQQSFEITATVVRYMLGTVAVETKSPYVIPLNGPAMKGDVQWKPFAYVGNVYKEKQSKIPEMTLHGDSFRLEQTGGATGILHAGEQRGFTYTSLVRANEKQFLGVVLHVVLDEGTKVADLPWYSEWVPLGGARHP